MNQILDRVISLYQLKTKEGNLLTLAHDKEGSIFILIPSWIMKKGAPTEISIKNEIFKLTPDKYWHQWFEIVDFTKGDAREKTDNDFFIMVDFGEKYPPPPERRSSIDGSTITFS